MPIDITNDLKGMHGVILNNYSSVNDIKNQLQLIDENKEHIKMAVVFFSPFLEKYYSHLKEYFINTCQIATQFVISK